jgi:hypothetical protein
MLDVSLSFEDTSPVETYAAFDPQLVEQAVSKMSNGSAPGWSGWTKELLTATCRSDDAIYSELGGFLAALHQCPDDRLGSITKAGKLIALNNSKDPCVIDARPITISELFTKLIGTLAMLRSPLNLHPCQRGVAHPGGTAQAIVEVQAAYDKHPERVLATFDVRNAFNGTSRSKIFELLRGLEFSGWHLLQYCRYMYGRHTDIFALAHKIIEKYLSADGVRQGDMPASLLFALVFTEAAVRAFKKAFSLEDKDEAVILQMLWLYLDDVTLVAAVTEIIAFKDALAAELSLLGLEMHMAKCRVLADRCSVEERALLTHHGFQLDEGCTLVLGSPVGSVDACSTWVLGKVDKWQFFWERLRHELLHPSTAISILRACGVSGPFII